MRLGQSLLERAIIGQGAGASTATADRLAERLSVGPAVMEIAPHEVSAMGRAEDRSRAPRRQVEAGPNAPLLIRLVQHPFVLETSRGQRGEGFATLDLSRPRAASAPRLSRYPKDPS